MKFSKRCPRKYSCQKIRAVKVATTYSLLDGQFPSIYVQDFPWVAISVDQVRCFRLDKTRVVWKVNVYFHEVQKYALFREDSEIPWLVVFMDYYRFGSFIMITAAARSNTSLDLPQLSHLSHVTKFSSCVNTERTSTNTSKEGQQWNTYECPKQEDGPGHRERQYEAGGRYNAEDGHCVEHLVDFRAETIE